MSFINLIISLYAVLIAIRVLIEATQVDYQNPVGEMLFKITNPLVMLAEKLLPKKGRINFAGIASIFLLVFLTAVIFAISASNEEMPSFIAVLWSTVIKSVLIFVRAGIYLLIAQSIMSWVSAASPIYTMLSQITAPLVNPLRKWVKPMSGFDLAPLAAFGILVVLHLLVTALLLPAGSSGFSFIQ